MSRSYLIALFSLLFINSYCQQFGAFPPSFKWRQINTDTARIIFLPQATKQAYRIATLVHKAAADTPFSMGTKLRKINIVLHNQTTLANGYVALAPFRSEYYLVPPADVFQFGNLPWYENLALHEYRHVQQYNNFRNGLSKGFFYIFGEQGLAFANSITVPDWFYEGDAVHAETALSPQGRGRLSSFLSGYNSLFLEGKNYSWMKLRNGSFKDYVPDHYNLGYLMVNYGFLKYGPDFWKNVTYDASSFKGLFYPFQKAIKKYSGKDYKSFRTNALTYYKEILPAQNNHVQSKSQTVTSYYFPQYISNDSLLYLKSSYKKVPAFYIRDQHGEHKIATQSIAIDEWFGYRNRMIVYSAYNTNRRWDLIDFNDIVLLDIDQKKEVRITHKNKYFTPDLSPDASQIVAIRITDSLLSEVVLLNTKGETIKTISGGDSLYFTNPRFISSSEIIVGVRRNNATMSLQTLNLQTDDREILIPYSSHTIGFPFVNGNEIYFTANFKGNDDIYRLNIENKHLSRLTNDLTANYYPSVYHDKIIWSHFTAEGLQLVEAPISSLRSDEFPHPYPTFTIPVAFEQNISSTPDRSFSVSKYPKSTGLLHFHSISPYYADPEISVSIFSDNILNTFSNEIYYTYNRNETSNAIGWNSTFGGFFPVLNAGVEYIYNRSIYDSSFTSLWNELETHVGYSVPLNFTNGRSYKFLNFGTNLVFNRTSPAGFYKDSFAAENIVYLSHFLNWSHYSQQSVQQIYPKIGYVIALNHKHELNEKGYQFLANGELFLPSFGNHSIVLTGSFQETNDVIFTNRFSISRGYPGFYYPRMWRVSGNYNFPIVYPDFGFIDLVYLKRLRGNLFYDLTRVFRKNKTVTNDLRSTGAEIFFDTRWWNELPVTFGFRYSYLLDSDFAGTPRTSFELILPVNLIPRN
jgi:hypothetical protein